MEFEIVSAKIFIEAVLPSLPLVCKYYEEYGAKFNKRSFVAQIIIVDADIEESICYEVTNGYWDARVNARYTKPDIEFTFNSIKHFNDFIIENRGELPKIKGLLKMALLLDFASLLNKLSSLLLSVKNVGAYNDCFASAMLLSEIFPATIMLLKSEALQNIAVHFRREENVLIHAIINENEIILPDIVLNYAPNENTCSKIADEFDAIFDNCEEFIKIIRDAEITDNFKENNDDYVVKFIAFFANLAKYYTRLEYRTK